MAAEMPNVSEQNFHRYFFIRRLIDRLRYSLKHSVWVGVSLSLIGFAYYTLQTVRMRPESATLFLYVILMVIVILAFFLLIFSIGFGTDGRSGRRPYRG